MWPGIIIRGHCETNVIMNKSMFCFVNFRGCVRDLEDYVYQFGLPVPLAYLSLPTSVTLCCLKLYPNHSQWWVFLKPQGPMSPK